MARKIATRQKRKQNPIVIGAGLTERWYFTHLQSKYNLRIKIRPRFFGHEDIICRCSRWHKQFPMARFVRSNPLYEFSLS